MRARHPLVCLLVVIAAGCQRTPKPALRLDVGPAANEKISFAPESAFAEYIELPGVGHELRITLASYAVSCENWIAPTRDQVLVNVLVTVPPGAPPGPGAYAWSGPSDRARALPSARIGPRGYEFPPGGSVTLSNVELEARGSVTGVLAFEFPGDAERPAKSLSGAFDAKLCRVSKAGQP